ncbi:hypothetical protein ABBQ32_000312 [Trebouxia sp. C0010 RCD-2024]
MQSVPEAAVEGEGLPAAHQLRELGYGVREDQPHPDYDKEPSESAFVAESSEESFVTAASHAAPAASVVTDLDYASLEDESDDENRNEALQQQSNTGLMSRVSSFPHQGIDSPASPFRPGPTNVRSTPFDWGSPRASAGATSQSDAGVGVPEAGSVTASWQGTGGSRLGSGSVEPSRLVSEGTSPRARFATASGRFSGGVSGQHMRGPSPEEADVENVNPQAVSSKPVINPAGAPSVLSPSLSAAPAAAPNQAVSQAPPLAASLDTTPAVGAKPFVSSKVLSEALFGTNDSPRAALTAKTPVSPFAQASTAAGVGGRAEPGAGAHPGGAVPSTGLEEGVSSRVQRLDGTPKQSGMAERVEEALMSATSPFSRQLSSGEVKPVLARLSQAETATMPATDQQRAVPQTVRGSGAASEGARAQARPGDASSITGAVAKGPKLDDIQPAEAAGSGRTAGPLPSAVSATSAPGSQAAPRPVVQEADGGKARFVCCGFGGRKAGSKSSSKR